MSYIIERWFFPRNSTSTLCTILYLVLTKTLLHQMHEATSEQIDEMQSLFSGQGSRTWRVWDSNPGSLATKASEPDHVLVKRVTLSLRK